MELLRKGKVESRLLDFFPPQKRSWADFEEHFKVRGGPGRGGAGRAWGLPACGGLLTGGLFWNRGAGLRSTCTGCTPARALEGGLFWGGRD